MQEIIYKGAVNPLSFGNVSYNLLKAMHKKKIKVSFFPIGDKLNFDSFDKASDDFKNWVVSSAQNRFNTVNKDLHTLSQWHLNGSESRISKSQTLFTFYEVDQPTSVEKSLVDLQDNTVFSSSHAANKFKELGCRNVSAVPIGFDEDFHETDEEYLPDKIHFGLMGKFENRKNTAQIIKNWARKYGNNYKYQLSCCVNNPFFKPEQMNQILNQCLEGKSYGNINFLPHLKTNSEVNEFLNAIDIDLTGLSGAEGWNIPAFNATALGKWSIVLNETSHKDWANKDNCILVNSLGKEPCYDGKFFVQGGEFNQGNIYFWDRDVVSQAMDDAVSKKGQINTAGEKLKDEFSYEKTVDRIITELEAIS